MSKKDKNKKDEQSSGDDEAQVDGVHICELGVCEHEPEETSCGKCDEYLGGWKRALADYDNLKKDLGREREEMRQYIKLGLAEDLITVLDNFDQAVKHRPSDLPKEVDGWVVGVCHVQKQFDDFLRGMNLEPFGTAGDKFDANLHDAAGERAEDDKKDQEILEVQTRGWSMGDRVVRPAKVIVNNIS